MKFINIAFFQKKTNYQTANSWLLQATDLTFESTLHDLENKLGLRLF
jgi:hypothetical protein